MSSSKRTTEQSQNNRIGFSTLQSGTFWADAQSCLEEYFGAQWHSRHDSVYRLILTGSQAHDADFLRVLQNTRGIVEMRPPPFPALLRVQRAKDEISQQCLQRERATSCIPNDPSYAVNVMNDDRRPCRLSSCKIVVSKQ